jgi:ABC-type multidrug transport system fused ATPase/permease subunit
VAVFLLEVVPLELQRRIVNDLVKSHGYLDVVMLCGAYFGAVLIQGATKLILNIYRGWVGEQSKRDLRRRICASSGSYGPASILPDAQGTAVSMVVADVEPVGGFIGTSISEPLLQAGILASVMSYIAHIDPWMGMAAFALFLPQLVFVPLMQHAMNRRAGACVWLLRQIGAGIITGNNSGACSPVDAARIDRVFRLNMGIFEFKFTMNFLMNLCSHLQVIAAFLIGGWFVLSDQLQIGGVVAFIAGVGRLNDPWGDLVNYFRDLSLSRVKYRLLVNALDGSTETRIGMMTNRIGLSKIKAQRSEVA